MTVRSSYLRVVIIALTAAAVLAPLSLAIYQSVLTAPLFIPDATLSLDAFNRVFSDPDFWSALITTIAVAAGITAIAVPLGAGLSFVMVRTNLPGRSWLEPFILIPVFVSTIVIAFGYVVALGPDGFVSTSVRSVIGIVPWNIHSIAALIMIAGLIHVPYVYLFTAASLRNLGTEMEEAARVAGANPWKVATEVSLPLARPAIVFSGVLVFYLGLELFGLPLVLGDPGGVLVLSTYLYKLTGTPGMSSYPLMAVVVVVIVAISAPLVLLQRLLAKDARPHATVRGRGLNGAPLPLGRWRWPAFLAIVLWFTIAVLIPLAGITLRSVVTRWDQGVALSDVLTLDHFRALLEYPDIMRGMINTLGIGIIGGAIAILCYTAIALAIHRRSSAWTRAVGFVVAIPRTLPGIAAGLAMLWVFLYFEFLTPLLATILSVWLAYTIVWLAYGTRLMSRALLQFGPELEDTARAVGADDWRIRRDVTLPLMRYGMLTGWLLMFLIFVREYATGVYLLGPGAEVIGSMLVSLWGTGAIDLVAALSVVNVAMIGIGVLIAIRLGVRPHG